MPSSVAPYLSQVRQLQIKPPEFVPGEPQFWTDPHIGREMLAVHLDPNTDAASRPPDVIQRSVAWIVDHLGLQAGDCVLDLGCGPGLYTSRLATYGLQVTGVDFSQNSIDYAQQAAQAQGLKITYRCQNYLELDDQVRFDAALLIFGDYCPLAPEQRARLLANVRRALKPSGWFVLDVPTPNLRLHAGLKNRWYAAESGFWKPGPHLVLEQGFGYSHNLYLDQYVVIEADGKVSVYRNWFQDYTADEIRAELAGGGFVVEGLWSDLQGAPYASDSDWIRIVARRAGS
jgi:SAM-dependent methyltransferase